MLAAPMKARLLHLAGASKPWHIFTEVALAAVGAQTRLARAAPAAAASARVKLQQSLTGWCCQPAQPLGYGKVCWKTESMVHLGWSIPMADPTYNIMGVGLHAFLMFAPFFALYEKRGMALQGIVLYATGPFMASMITSNLLEQASIWCFFSIAQIAIMLFLVRETLIVKWGKTGKALNKIKEGAKEDTKKATKKSA